MPVYPPDFSQTKTPVLVLAGPTAVGKTALSLRLSRQFDCEIVSMDSMQVYRFMDIGTAKASPEERQIVPHHLIDIRNPDEQYDAAQFVHDATVTIQDIAHRGKIPLLTGGTGLYLSCLINGLFDQIKVSDQVRASVKARLHEEGRERLYQELTRIDPESGVRVHPNDTQRIVRGLEIYYSSGITWTQHLHRQARENRVAALPDMLLIGLDCERALLNDRIRQRTGLMMTEVFAQEVRDLLEQGYAPSLPSMQAIGYRHMLNYLADKWTLAEATEILIKDTRHYAKRQMTWFRKYANINWYQHDKSEKITNDIDKFLSSRRSMRASSSKDTSLR